MSVTSTSPQKVSSPLKFSWQHAMRDDPSLEPTTKHILLNLATHMALDGTGVFPSLSQQVQETGLARSTICAHLKKAEDAGWIVREQHRNPQKPDEWTHTVYIPVWPGGPPVGLGSPSIGNKKVIQNIPLAKANGHDEKSNGAEEGNLTTSRWLYATGKRILAEAEKPPKNPGALISKWLREFGEKELATALIAAEPKHSPQPVAYIEGVLRKSHKRDVDCDAFGRPYEVD